MHFVISVCGNAFSCHRYMFLSLWLNKRLQFNCQLEYKMNFLQTSCRATAAMCPMGCQSLCVFTVRKCSILSRIHVLVFVTEHETPVTLQINIRCIFWEKVVRQQHVTGLPITLCFHCAEIPYLENRYMFWCLWLNMTLQLHCNYRFNVIFAKNCRTKACDWGCQPLCIFHYAEMPYLVTDTCYGDCDWTWDSHYIANIY
jgi:hypothetical protein